MDMGYIISKVVRFYSMSYEDVMELPIYTFWELSSNANRISAEEDKRFFTTMLNAIGVAFGGDSKRYIRQLNKEIGRTVEGCEDSEYDKGGIDNLKRMLGG
jgi:hypothetical protein